MKINMQIRFPQQSLSFRRQCLLLPAFFYVPEDKMIERRPTNKVIERKRIAML